uniref:EF-hand domain-containing protein n=1 Tax=Salix viminalis TaxID=40686 RepID=A0A6N2MPH2_SALVM
MSVEILDGATIVNFLEDEEAFSVSVRDRFAHLDSNHDGQLSYEEMLKELQGLRVMETHFGVDVETDRDELVRVYDSLFVQFDHDLNGTVDLEEFKAETADDAPCDGWFLACSDGAGRRQFLEESCGVGICQAACFIFVMYG